MNIEHSDSSQLLLAKYNIQNDFIVTEMILRVFCHWTWIDFTISFIKNVTSRLGEEPVIYIQEPYTWIWLIGYQLVQTGISYTRTSRLWWSVPKNYQKKISLFFYNWFQIVFLLHILWPTVYSLSIFKWTDLQFGNKSGLLDTEVGQNILYGSDTCTKPKIQLCFHAGTRRAVQMIKGRRQ